MSNSFKLTGRVKKKKKKGKKAERYFESTYAKVHGSVSVDALQRKEAEESACGKVHDPAFKITEIYS